MTLTDPDQLPMHINFPVVRLDVIKVGQFFLLARYCVFIGILLWTGFIPEIVPAPVPVKKGVTAGSVRMDQRCQLQWKSHDYIVTFVSSAMFRTKWFREMSALPSCTLMSLFVWERFSARMV